MAADEWGLGRYEETARELEPAAQAAVAELHVEPGMNVLDVACGTGNAATFAAAAGASVSGLDSSPRLIGVARERLPDGDFVLGDAADLPYEDASFGAAVSVFGVVFAEPAQRAVAELARVVRPGGRIAITSWPYHGPVFEVFAMLRVALERVEAAQSRASFSWGDPAALAELLGRHGDVEVSERKIPRDPAETPEQIWARWEASNPAWMAARAKLEPVGAWADLRKAVTGALAQRRARGEDASPYLLTTLVRG